MDRQIVACPKCHGEFIFSRSDAAEIDECGFESYKLECPRCAFPLGGVIDPFDNKLAI
jgi:hypothetical protein